MSKQSMREEAERLIRETMERKAIVVKQGNTRIETTCGKCGAPNRISARKRRDPREICLQSNADTSKRRFEDQAASKIRPRATAVRPS